MEIAFLGFFSKGRCVLPVLKKSKVKMYAKSITRFDSFPDIHAHMQFKNIDQGYLPRYFKTFRAAIQPFYLRLQLFHFGRTMQPIVAVPSILV